MTAEDAVRASLGRVLEGLAKPAAPDDDLEIPAFLRIPQGERDVGWTTPPRHEVRPLSAGTVDPERQAALDRAEAERRAKASARIGTMKARIADREAVKAGHRWDVTRGQWVPVTKEQQT